MKKWTKRNRVFLNAPSSGCFAGVAWQVSTHQERDWSGVSVSEETVDNFDPKKLPKKWTMNGSIEINREAQTHYVSRKGNLRALYKMQRELDQFIELCEKALKDAEKANAKS